MCGRRLFLWKPGPHGCYNSHRKARLGISRWYVNFRVVCTLDLALRLAALSFFRTAVTGPLHPETFFQFSVSATFRGRMPLRKVRRGFSIPVPPSHMNSRSNISCLCRPERSRRGCIPLGRHSGSIRGFSRSAACRWTGRHWCRRP